MSRVAVIIPTHNRVEMLLEAIDSAHSAARDVEVIVVDDASNDATPDRLRKLAGVKYLRLDKNVGQAAARNAGLDVSSSAFVSFLDDDDRRVPGSIDLQIEVLEASPAAALVYGQVSVADPETRAVTGKTAPASCPRGDLFWDLLRFNFIYCPSVVARREKVVAAGLFRPRFTGVEDWDLWIRMAENSIFESVNLPVAVYRDWHSMSGQTSSNRFRMCLVSAAAQEAGLELPRARSISREERTALQATLRTNCSYEMIVAAKQHAKSGALLAALRAVLAAAYLEPRYFWRKVSGRARAQCRLASAPITPARQSTTAPEQVVEQK